MTPRRPFNSHSGPLTKALIEAEIAWNHWHRRHHESVIDALSSGRENATRDENGKPVDISSAVIDASWKTIDLIEDDLARLAILIATAPESMS